MQYKFNAVKSHFLAFEALYFNMAFCNKIKKKKESITQKKSENKKPCGLIQPCQILRILVQWRHRMVLSCNNYTRAVGHIKKMQNVPSNQNDL